MNYIKIQFLTILTFFLFSCSTTLNQSNNLTVVDQNFEDKNFNLSYKVDIEPVIPKSKLLKKIKYPKEAHIQEIEEIIIVELYIENDGEIQYLKVMKGDNQLLINTVIKAFREIRCIPAQINDKNVASKLRFPVRFKINK